MLQGLLKTIPAFWGSDELSQVAFLYLDQYTSAPNANISEISALTKSLVKKIPPKILIPGLLEIWDPLQGSNNVVSLSYRFYIFDPICTI